MRKKDDRQEEKQKDKVDIATLGHPADGGTSTPDEATKSDALADEFMGLRGGEERKAFLLKIQLDLGKEKEQEFLDAVTRLKSRPLLNDNLSKLLDE